ncbi:hypothetical protein [Methanolapillus africanus]
MVSESESLKKMYVVSHCLLNPAARVKGIKKPVPFDFYFDYFNREPTGGRNDYLLQLPCPESIYFGIGRGKVTKDQLDFPKYRLFCADLFKPYAAQIEQFERDGFSILILGVPKSPSCSVFTTTVGLPSQTDPDLDGTPAPGQGVFMDEIQKELTRRNVRFVLAE